MGKRELQRALTQPARVRSPCGPPTRACLCRAAPRPADDMWVMHWRVGRVNCTFKVRVRRGWAHLRAFLAARADRYETFVCSKGKREYIQLLWLMLDPAGQLIPEQGAWGRGAGGWERGGGGAG